MLKRREFLSKGIIVTAESVLALTSAKKIFGQEKIDLSKIIEEKKSNPPYFDGLLYLSEDREDVRKSGLSGYICDVSAGETIEGKYYRRFNLSLKNIVGKRKLLRENETGLFLATKGSQAREAYKSGRTAVFFQFQSCEPITEDLEVMAVFYELGLRILQITHHYGNIVGGGCLDKEWTGLTELGIKAVEKMNELGIIPDLSHANDITALDVLKTSKKPVIISHTGCRAIVKSARCTPDNIIRDVAKSGGIIGIFCGFYTFWLTNDPLPTIDSLINQLDHVVKIGGVDAVGLASDLFMEGYVKEGQLINNNSEAVKSYYPWWKSQAGKMGFDELPKHCFIPELNNAKRYYTIQAALEKRGYSTSQIEKIMGGNWIRVLTECLG